MCNLFSRVVTFTAVLLSCAIASPGDFALGGLAGGAFESYVASMTPTGLLKMAELSGHRLGEERVAELSSNGVSPAARLEALVNALGNEDFHDAGPCVLWLYGEAVIAAQQAGDKAELIRLCSQGMREFAAAKEFVHENIGARRGRIPEFSQYIARMGIYICDILRHRKSEDFDWSGKERFAIWSELIELAQGQIPLEREGYATLLVYKAKAFPNMFSLYKNEQEREFVNQKVDDLDSATWSLVMEKYALLQSILSELSEYRSFLDEIQVSNVLLTPEQDYFVVSKEESVGLRATITRLMASYETECETIEAMAADRTASVPTGSLNTQIMQLE